MPRPARKQAVANRAVSRRFFAIVLPVLLLFGLAVLGFHYLSQPGRMPLRVIEVTGEFTYLDQAAIEARVAKAIRGGFLDVDLQRIRAQVLDMPWVDQVSIRRVWPDTLKMHVTEQVPLAYWNEDALVNFDGRVFRPKSLPDLGKLPHLYARDAAAREVVAFYLQLHAQLLSQALRIDTVRLNRRNEWKVGFRNGLKLILGREDIAQRQQAFLYVYPKLLAHMRRQPERIDMRYAHGFAVRWRETAGDS